MGQLRRPPPYGEGWPANRSGQSVTAGYGTHKTCSLTVHISCRRCSLATGPAELWHRTCLKLCMRYRQQVAGLLQSIEPQRGPGWCNVAAFGPPVAGHPRKGWPGHVRLKAEHRKTSRSGGALVRRASLIASELLPLTTQQHQRCARKLCSICRASIALVHSVSPKLASGHLSRGSPVTKARTRSVPQASPAY